jgi:hypothetical protein
VPKRETNSLARARYAPMRGQRMEARRPSVEAKYVGKSTGEVRIVQYWIDEHRSSFKDFDPTTYPKITENTVEEDCGSW